jgi:adenosylhomocysteine nucleosidase
MKTGILAPMPEEIEMILEHMHVDRIESSGNRSFYIGKINGQECVVSLSRIGKVASSVTAAILIEKFNVDRIIVTGVAGGIHESIQAGDIVIATQCIQHDLDCSPLFPPFEAPLLGKSAFECEETMVQQAFQVCEHLVEQELHEFITDEHLQELNITQPKVHQGLLVSGDQFIGTEAQLKVIQTKLPEALFVEMEGAAVGQICYEYNIPFVVIRSISDKANAVAHIDFNKYINDLAKHYTWRIINKLMAS